jgi:hypothetical protein
MPISATQYKIFKVNRFDNIAIDAEPVAFADVGLFLGGGEHHDGDEGGARVGFDAAQHLQAVEFGEFQVEEDEARTFIHGPAGVDALAEDVVERLDAIVGHLDMVGELGPAQGAQGHFEIVGVVLDEQDFGALITHGSLLPR